jgi:hypothetical protein
MAKTTLIHYTATGRVCFRAEMPNHLTQKQIKTLCRKWRVPIKGLIIKYS